MPVPAEEDQGRFLEKKKIGVGITYILSNVFTMIPKPSLLTVFIGHVYGQIKHYCIRSFSVSLGAGTLFCLPGSMLDTDGDLVDQRLAFMQSLYLTL